MDQGQRYKQVQNILDFSMAMGPCVVDESGAIILGALRDVISVPLSIIRTSSLGSLPTYLCDALGFLDHVEVLANF